MDSEKEENLSSPTISDVIIIVDLENKGVENASESQNHHDTHIVITEFLNHQASQQDISEPKEPSKKLRQRSFSRRQIEIYAKNQETNHRILSTFFLADLVLQVLDLDVLNMVILAIMRMNPKTPMNKKRT